MFKSFPALTLEHVQHTFLELYIANNGQLLTAYAELKQLYPQMFIQEQKPQQSVTEQMNPNVD